MHHCVMGKAFLVWMRRVIGCSDAWPDCKHMHEDQQLSTVSSNVVQCNMHRNM